jgi:hypothetical protein
LQLIAEDLDGIVAGGADTTLTIQKKLRSGWIITQMEILRTYMDEKNEPQPLERIVWQSNLDVDTGLLALFRSHGGLTLEDKLLDEQKELWERELFVPVCSDVTFFSVEVIRGEDLLDNWSGAKLPTGIVVTISFVEPFKAVDGTLDVPEEDKIVRTIAIDRARKIGFTIAAPVDTNEPSLSDMESEQEDSETEPNDVPSLPE